MIGPLGVGVFVVFFVVGPALVFCMWRWVDRQDKKYRERSND